MLSPEGLSYSKYIDCILILFKFKYEQPQSLTSDDRGSWSFQQA